MIKHKSYTNHLYSNDIRGKKIALLGPYPPPYGGISVHLERVAQKFIGQDNTVKHFDTTQECKRHFFSYFFRLIVFLCRFRPNIVYYHTLFLRNYWLEFALLAVFKKLLRYRFITVEHNYRYLSKRTDLFKKVLNFFMHFVDQQVFIGDVLFGEYQKHGMSVVSNFSIESPFLPPDIMQETEIIKCYSPQLNDFLCSHSPLLIANASQVLLFDGIDLYGFDMCVALMHKLIGEYSEIGIVFAVSGVYDRHYFEEIHRKLERLNINHSWFFLMDNIPLWPLLKKATVFVRPTFIDSFSVSVQEALYVKTPVVASNVGVRPESTLLFINRDQLDFEDKVRKVLLASVQRPVFVEDGCYL